MPLVASTVLLLLPLMLASCCSAASLSSMCKYYYPPVQCPKEGMEDWTLLGQDRCAKAFSTPRVNFTIAEETCVGYDGHLVSIYKATEQHQVVCATFRATPKGAPYWIGLKLAFHYEGHLMYDWTDGDTLGYSWFAAGQPDFRNESEECVETNYRHWGLWNDVRCNLLRGFVCAVKI